MMSEPSNILKGLRGIVFAFLLVLSGFRGASSFQRHSNIPQTVADDSSAVSSEVGRFGGNLLVSQRSEPKTLNPLVAQDGSSKEIIGLIAADLIHINRYTQLTEASLAASWDVSPDRLHYTLHLRTGLRFSDGYPFDADDVVFTFQSYLDERIHAPQRDLLIISGQPVLVRKVDKYTVVFVLPQPYAAAERLFDSIFMLPQHLLRQSFDQGRLTSVWSLNTAPAKIVGLGPFRLKEYLPGQRIVLERNPYYWKKDSKGRSLPYLNNITCIFALDADAEAMRFEAGETDIINRLSAADFAVLEKDQQSRHFHLYDLGPGLEYSFLFFNQNSFRPDERLSLARKQTWFRELAFRQAISSAIDREDIIRLVYQGRARPLSVQVTPGNKRWVDPNIGLPSRSLEHSRLCLRSGGFLPGGDGSLRDSHGNLVELSLAVNAGNPQQVQMATLIAQDLKEIGINVAIDSLDFNTFLDRIFTTYTYEAAIISLADGDADPNSEMNVLTSNGGTHVWSLKPDRVQTTWQLEIDRLMREQLSAQDYQQRKAIYDRVQTLISQNLPVIFLVSPNILVGAKDRVGNFHPAILSSYTLWNAEQIFIKQEHAAIGHS